MIAFVNKRNTPTSNKNKQMTASMQRHGYSLVNQTDVEDGQGKGGGSSNEWKRFKFGKRGRLFKLIAFSIVAVGAFFFVIRSKDEEPMQVEPFPGNWGVGHVPMPTKSAEMDEKGRHKIPFLAERVFLTADKSVSANEAFFKQMPAQTERFSSHLILDKPVYRPGETVRGALFLFNAFDATVVKQDDRLGSSVQIKDAKGVNIASFYGSSFENGVLAFEWAIPNDVAGGDFTMTLETHSFPKVITRLERTFEVRATRTSNAKINKKIDFAKEGYSGGDVVSFTLTVDDSADETSVMVVANVDDTVVHETSFQKLEGSSAVFSFKLPATISRGEGIVSVKVKRGAILETVSKTIPIVTQSLDLGLFPEGGVLAVGVQQRVYVEALDALHGKPVDFAGDIYSDSDPSKPLAHIESVHEGRAVSPLFFVPRGATDVYIKLTSPQSVAGQKKSFPLRKTQSALEGDFVSLTVDRSTFQSNLNAVIFKSGASKDKYFLTLSKREAKISDVELQFRPSSSLASKSKDGLQMFEASHTLTLVDDKFFGVMRLTLYNSERLPLAERLVFRMPDRALEIEVGAVTVEDVSAISDIDATTFQSKTFHAAPSDGVAVKIKSWSRQVDALTGELKGPRQPVPAVVALRVTDSALAATVENRLLPPRIPEAVWLESEVDRLNGAGEYLYRSKWAWHSGDSEAAKPRGTFATRLDLLLGTQGWRRFAYYDVGGFLNTGQAPLLNGRLVPAGVSNEGSPSSPSPVSRIALERLFGARAPGLPVMASGAANDNAVMFARAPPRHRPVMMMKAAAVPEVEAMLADGPDIENNEDNADELLVEPPMNDEAAQAPQENEAKRQDVGVDQPQDAGRDQMQDVGDDLMNDDEVDQMDEAPAPARWDGALAVKQKMRRFAPPPQPKFVRIYAHPQRKYLKKEFEQGAKRSDFTETVYFNPSVKTECSASKECAATVSFGLSESSTAAFAVHADGFETDEPSTIGCGDMVISTATPLEIDFVLPSITVSGDRPVIPISITNRVSAAVDLKSATVPMPALVRTKTKDFHVDSTTSTRLYAELVTDKPVRGGEKRFNFTISASAGSARDAVTRRSVMMAKGFPAAQFSGGTLKAGDSTFELQMPEDYIPGTLQVIARAYTSPIGRLNKALEELIREPCGCFEQTSSTTYPLVFVVQYLKSHTGSNPAVVQRALDALKSGYDRLASYESPGGGFEWFGAEPGHEALTAYGLLQFAAMAHPSVGIKVDKSMVERTKKWMDSRRDKKGGFLRNTRALDSFGAAPIETTNAYITWALVRAGLLRSPQRDPEMEALVAKATNENDASSKDPYLVALAALSLYDATEPSPQQLQTANKLAKKLVTMQDEKEGSLNRGAVTTITSSRGEALEIETTALGVLVWLHESDTFAANARQAIDFLAARCKNGRFSSTQATALSIMAIVEFDRVFSKPLQPGAVELRVDGKVVETLRFGTRNKDGAKTAKKSKPQTSEDVENLLGRTEDECTGGSEWNTCGTACPLTCDSPVGGPCTMQCVARCQCPSDKPIMNNEGQCVEKCVASVDKGDADEDGVLNFDGEKILAAFGGSLKTSKDVSLRMVLDDGFDSKAAPSIPYSLAFKYAVVKPVRSPKFTYPAPLELKVNYVKAKDKNPVEGDVVTVRVSLKNVALEKDGKDAAVPMVVAVIGIPGGVEPRTDQLRELKQSKLVDYVESKPGQVIFYWRALPPKASMDIPLQLTATVPGVYESPASRAYLFYTDEDKVWADGFKMKIEPQRNSGGDDDFVFWQ